MEPILLRDCTTRGTPVRFHTEFISFTQDADGVSTSVRDVLTGHEYTIRSKYLLACDGGRSKIVEQLQLPLNVFPAGGVAMNIHFRCDLTPFMPSRISNLTHTLHPGRINKDWAINSLIRAVKPWTEWYITVFSKPGVDIRAPSTAEYMEEVEKMIGPGCPPTTYLGTIPWKINETVAKYYSVGNVFCLGDAVHRHPPFNGVRYMFISLDGTNR